MTANSNHMVLDSPVFRVNSRVRSRGIQWGLRTATVRCRLQVAPANRERARQLPNDPGLLPISRAKDLDMVQLMPRDRPRQGTHRHRLSIGASHPGPLFRE